jgi:hypothetical protein
MRCSGIARTLSASGKVLSPAWMREILRLLEVEVKGLEVPLAADEAPGHDLEILTRGVGFSRTPPGLLALRGAVVSRRVSLKTLLCLRPHPGVRDEDP